MYGNFKKERKVYLLCGVDEVLRECVPSAWA